MDIIYTSKTLIEKVKKNNDNKAWSRFYTLYSPLIFGFAKKYKFSNTEAEDIVQETMFLLLKHLPNFQYNKGRGKFRNYIFQIEISVIAKIVKRKKGVVNF